MAASVYRRRLIQFLRNVILNIGLGDNDVEHVDGRQQYHDPRGIIQSDLLHQDVCRHQAALEIHGEHHKECEKLPAAEISSGQRIGKQHGKDDIDQSSHQCVKNGVAVGSPYLRIFKDFLITKDVESLRPEYHPACIDIIRV